MPTTKANIRAAPIRRTAAVFDGHHGEGNPGGSCDSCPLNQYGSGKNGAKACKNRRRLYLLREGDIFPVILSLPTGSLKSFTRYLMRVIPKYKNSNAVVTKFTLKKSSQRHWHELFPGTVCCRTGIVSGRISADRSCDRTGQGS